MQKGMVPLPFQQSQWYRKVKCFSTGWCQTEDLACKNLQQNLFISREQMTEPNLP